MIPLFLRVSKTAGYFVFISTPCRVQFRMEDPDQQDQNQGRDDGDAVVSLTGGKDVQRQKIYVEVHPVKS